MNDAYIIGISQVNVRRLSDIRLSQLELVTKLLNDALKDASPKINYAHLNGLISMHPGCYSTFVDESINSISHQYYTQWLATKLNLYLPTNKPFITKNYAFGGATPVSQCIQAKYLINNNNNIQCIATILMQSPNSKTR
eukprot:89607_1